MPWRECSAEVPLDVRASCRFTSLFLVLVLQLNALLGKKGRSLRDLNVYWDVATYFELHAVQHDWPKACQAALHMYLLNPPVWYLKSTINNLKILHRATRIRDQQRLREQVRSLPVEENTYSFWIDFFADAINSHSPTAEERELPAQVPVCNCKVAPPFDGTENELLSSRFSSATTTKRRMERLSIMSTPKHYCN